MMGDALRLGRDLVQQAVKEGCRISLGTDSNGSSQLRFMEFSAESALLVGMPAADLLLWVGTVRDQTRPKNRSRWFSFAKSPLHRHSRRNTAMTRFQSYLFQI